jgi:hypothetical protein
MTVAPLPRLVPAAPKKIEPETRPATLPAVVTP